MYDRTIEVLPEGERWSRPTDLITACSVGHVLLPHYFPLYDPGIMGGDGTLTDEESTSDIIDAVFPQPPQALFFAKKTPAQIAQEQLNAENARKEAARRLAAQEAERKRLNDQITAQDQNKAGQ